MDFINIPNLAISYIRNKYSDAPTAQEHFTLFIVLIDKGSERSHQYPSEWFVKISVAWKKGNYLTRVDTTVSLKEITSCNELHKSNVFLISGEAR